MFKDKSKTNMIKLKKNLNKMKKLFVLIVAISTFSTGISVANISHSNYTTISESITYKAKKSVKVVGYTRYGKVGGYHTLCEGSDGRYYLQDNNLKYWLVERNYDRRSPDGREDVSCYSHKIRTNDGTYYFNM